MDSNSRERLKTNVEILHRHRRKTGTARDGGKLARLHYENRKYKPSSVLGRAQTGHETPPRQSPFIPEPPRAASSLYTQSRVYLLERRNQSCQKQAFWDAWRKMSSSEEDSTVRALET